MTLTKILAEIERIETERQAADAAYVAQLIPLRQQQYALQQAATEAKWRKKIAGYPPEVVAALRESAPPEEHWTALDRRGLLYKGWRRATWNSHGIDARSVLARMDQEKT